MYFLHGWVDAICPAVMYMFDVDDNKILVQHKPRKRINLFFKFPCTILVELLLEHSFLLLTDTLKINPTLLQYVN